MTGSRPGDGDSHVRRRFLDQRRTSPTGIVVVAALHVAVLGAVIVAKGPQILPKIPVLQTYDVPDAPVPDPVPPPPAPPAAKTAPRVDAPIPTVKLPPVETAGLRTVPTIDLFPPDTGRVEPTVVPLAPPVLVEAAVDPRYAGALQPPYPPTLARAEIEGRVTVRVLVGADGRVKRVEQVRADDPGFFAATERQALRAWRFRPATRDGVAVESWRTMTVRFQLER